MIGSCRDGDGRLMVGIDRMSCEGDVVSGIRVHEL